MTEAEKAADKILTLIEGTLYVHDALAIKTTISEAIDSATAEKDKEIAFLEETVARYASVEKRFPVCDGDSIPMKMGRRAYAVYAKKYGKEQSFERIAERGGFYESELDIFIPGWRKELSELAEKDAEIKWLESECDMYITAMCNAIDELLPNGKEAEVHVTHHLKILEETWGQRRKEENALLSLLALSLISKRKGE